MSTITLVMYSSTSTSTQKVLVLEYEYKYTSTITPSLVGSDNINNQDRIRLDTFIKKANGTVRMERVMDRVQKFSGS